MAAKKKVTKKAPAKKSAKKGAKKAAPAAKKGAKKATKKAAPVKTTKKAKKVEKVEKVANKSSKVLMGLTVYVPGVIEYSGTLVAITDTSVTLDHKRKKSKKLLRSTFPMSQITLVSGARLGGETSILVESQRIFYGADVEAVKTEHLGNGMVRVTDAEGDVYIVRETLAELSSELGDAPKEKAGKKGKKPKDEEEDEEEEEEEEDEEEEDEEEEEEEEEDEEEEEEEEEEDEDEEEEDEEEEEGDDD